MNLFRSEEHAKNWSGYAPAAEGGLLTLEGLMEMLSSDLFRYRMNGEYVSNMAEYRKDFMARIKKVTSDHPFWRVGD